MNDLAILSDAQLDRTLAERNDRATKIKTREGIKTVTQEMLKIFAVLESCGYQINPDGRKAAAAVWAKLLSNEVVVLGFAGLQKAIEKVIESDTRSYRSLPNIATVKEACHTLGGDPMIEKARRDQAKREAKIEAEHAAEVEEWKRNNPEEWLKIERKVQND